MRIVSLHYTTEQLNPSSVSRSQCLPNSQLRELEKAGIPRDFYGKKALDSWYRSFLHACSPKDRGQLSRERFIELVRKYAIGQGKTVGEFVDKLANQLFDGFEYPKAINAYIGSEQNGIRHLKRERAGSYDDDRDSIDLARSPTGCPEQTERCTKTVEPVDETDLPCALPRALRSDVTADGRPQFITFNRFMVVMTQIMDLWPAGKGKRSTCRDLRVEWMFEMITGPKSCRMTEENWVNIHQWVRRLNGQAFGERQDRVVREDFRCMITDQDQDVCHQDFEQRLDCRA